MTCVPEITLTQAMINVILYGGLPAVQSGWTADRRTQMEGLLTQVYTASVEAEKW